MRSIFGWQLTAIHEKLLDVLEAIELVNPHVSFGHLFLKYTNNVQLLYGISYMTTMQSWQAFEAYHYLWITTYFLSISDS